MQNESVEKIVKIISRKDNFDNFKEKKYIKPHVKIGDELLNQNAQ